MTPFEEDVLFDCLEQCQAWRMLHDPAVAGELNAEELLALCKAAGYSEAASQRAATERANRRLDKNLPP